MKPFLLILLLFANLVCAAEPGRSHSKRLSHAIDSLDRELRHRDIYISHRHRHIDSLRQHGRKHPDARYYRNIGNEYRGFNTDSAITYLNNSRIAAISEKDTAMAQSVEIDYASQLSKNALFSEAIEILRRLDVEKMPPREQMHYYSILGQIHIDASEFFTLKEDKDRHLSLAITALDSLTEYFPENSLARRLTDAQKYYLKGQSTMALGELNELYDTVTSDDPWFAMLTSMLAKYYKDQPDRHEEYLYFLTLSAIADIRSANGEATSLARLGNEMFTVGDLDHAYLYLTTAGDVLNESGSRMMITQMASPLSVLAETIHAREKRHKKISWLIFSVMIIALGCSAWLLARQYRRTQSKDRKNELLSESVSSRELYISKLLDLCAVYVEGLEDYNRLVSRKLKAGQAQDMYKIAESGSALREQIEKFYTVFDSAILNIFPNFVEEVNNLLLPDKRITPPSAEKLTPELRIAAFMRLGVTDSGRISKFLGLSLNTVYTYRNRTKARAKNRETFETEAMKIGEIR